MEIVKMKKFSEEIRQQLVNKRVCLCGTDEWTKELLKNELEYMDSQNKLNLTVAVQPDQLKKEDLVLVLGEINGAGSECFEKLDLLMKEMERIGQSAVESVLYLSDDRVYGKSFGPQVSRREEELGYVCHTKLDEMDVQCMRMAEHLVVRMAKEQKLPVKIVRMEREPGAQTLVKVLPDLFVLMLRGENGEIYNVDSRSMEEELAEDNLAEGKSVKENSVKENSVKEKLMKENPVRGNKSSMGKRREQERSSLSWTEDRSPLTAMEIRMNTEKVRNYVASGFFE